MPKIACPKGRTRIVGGKAVKVWHKVDGSDCPLCASPPPLAPATEPITDKSATASPSTEPTTAGHVADKSPPPKKPGLMRRLGFGDKTTAPELALAPPKNPEPTYFVDAPHVKKFASLCYGAGRWAFNLWDKFAMTEEAGMKTFVSKHPDLLTLSDFEKEAIDLDPATDMWGKFATGFTRLIGCKTQAQAHSAIGTLDLLGHFGALIGFGAEHIWASWKAGKPFREAKRAAKKAAALAARKVKHDERASTEGEGGTVPEIGRGSATATA